MAQQVIDRLTSVFRQTFEDEAIELFDEMSSNDLEKWDSLMHVGLMVGVEKEFGFRFRAEELGRVRNVGDILRIVESRGR